MKPGFLAAASVRARRSGRLVGKNENPTSQTTVLGTYALRREVHCQVHLSSRSTTFYARKKHSFTVRSSA